MKSRFSWVFQDRTSGDLVLVQKPNKQEVDGMYRVLDGVFYQRGFMPYRYLGVSVSAMRPRDFKKRYSLLSGLNTKGV